MPLGKDSITKRVAKPAEAPVAAPAETPAPVAKKAPAKKPATVKTTTIAKIAPETVKAVTGKCEGNGFEKVMLGEDLPAHLL